MTQATLRRGTPRRLARQLLALLAVLVLLVGIVPPAAAAGVGPDADSTKLEPALQRALTANPSGTFRVIVTQQPAKDRSDRRGKSAQVEADIAGGGGRVTRRLGIVDGHAATVSGKQLAQLSRNPKIKSISLDRRIKIQQIATVPLVGSVTTSLTGGLQSTNVQAANAPQVWAQGDIGQGVTVAVFDSGIAPSADLPTAIAGVDTVYNTTGLNDKGGHGTHVAGIIAGNGAMSAGAYKGVAPGARLVSVKVTDDQGNATYSSIIAGIAWVLANQRTYNIKVANISLGAAAQTGYADDPLDAAVELLWFRGITVVAAAGNDGPTAGTIHVPGNDPYVVTVGATDDNLTASTTDDMVPDWTSRGPTAYDGLNKPDLAASGRRVVSIRSIGSALDQLLGLSRVVSTKYFRLSGTSMAAPAVSGTVALMLQANPNLTPNQIKAILKSTARAVTGADRSSVGAGQVDAAAAVALARTSPTARANVGLIPSQALLKAIVPVLQTMKPKWRHTGWWMGRYWTNGSWDNGSWDNGGWDNGSWDNGSWDALAALNLDWENMGWDSAGWDQLGVDDSGWDNGSWDNGSWDNGSWDSGGWDSATEVD